MIIYTGVGINSIIFKRTKTRVFKRSMDNSSTVINTEYFAEVVHHA